MEGVFDRVTESIIDYETQVSPDAQYKLESVLTLASLRMRMLFFEVRLA